FSLTHPAPPPFYPLSLHDALPISRIARLMKDDRDKNFIAKNADGATVNRWLSTGFLAASASSNETGYITHKVVRNLGILAFDNQDRKSTRLNSSHVSISYAVFCLK